MKSRVDSDFVSANERYNVSENKYLKPGCFLVLRAGTSVAATSTKMFSQLAALRWPNVKGTTEQRDATLLLSVEAEVLFATDF